MEGSQRGGSFPQKRFTPDEQAVAVWFSHLVIAIAVTMFMLVSMKEWPSGWFLGGEGIIFVMFLILVPTWDRPDVVRRRFFSRNSQGSVHRDWRKRGFTTAFIATFFVQFLALTPLLGQTGGPIDSPFVQLALAFAVFTQILANEVHTMVFGVIASVAYYWYMLEWYDFGGIQGHPPRWVYGAVTTLIVVVTVGLAVLDRLDSDRRVAKTSGSSMDVGEG